MPEIHFYGVKCDPPGVALAKAFGSDATPIVLSGGQGTTYRSGEIILKPTGNIESSNWQAELFSKIESTTEVRIAKPVKSTKGLWVHEGYVAWTVLEGKHTVGNYDEKLSASIAFHKLLKDFPKPSFLGTASSSWATADLVAWQKIEFRYDTEFMSLYNQIKPHLHPISVPEQLIHGDCLGNMLFQPRLPTGVIDFSPAWAPTGFAEGIMFADAISWENADLKELTAFFDIPNFDQFAWRGILRRITEQAEHMKWFNKDKAQAFKEASVFQRAIDCLNNIKP